MDKIKRHLISVFPTITRLMVEKSKNVYVKGKEWGDVLEIGARNLALKGDITSNSYKLLDIEEGENVDYVYDIHKTSLDSELFDTVFAFEVLEHLYDPKVAVNEIFRLLRPGGTLIGTTRFIYPYHGLPYDYYRFTEFALRNLFNDFADIKVLPHGSLFISSWDLWTQNIILWPLKILNPLFVLFQNKHSHSPSGFTFIVKRSDQG